MTRRDHNIEASASSESDCSEPDRSEPGVDEASLVAVRRIALREIRLPLREPFATSAGEVRDRRILLLRIEDVDGFESWSECVALATPSYLPETIDTARHALEHWLIPKLLGASFSGPEAVDRELRRGVRGHRMAIAALEMGFWALIASRKGERLADLLARRAGVAPNDRVPTGIAVGMQESLEKTVDKVAAAVREGYQRVKIKIGPGRDFEPLRALREAFPDLALTADANSAYDLEHAEDLMRLDALNLSMIEQPLAWDDLLLHADLQERLRTPICLDESILGARNVEEAARLGSGRIINLKPGRVGGFVESLKIHDFCRRRGLGLWCGGMLEGGVGRAYNVALGALPGFNLPGDLSPSARYWERDFVNPEWTMTPGGEVVVPSGAGLGISVDLDRIEDLTVRKTSHSI